MQAVDLTDDVKLTCTLTGTSPDYGTVYVDQNMILIHAPAEADASDTLHLENCILSVETEENEYHLNGNVLGVIRHRLNGSVTAEAWVYTAVPEKLVEFKYDSNGLRTQKKVTDHGQTVTTDYIYHGKKLVGLTCGNDTLHFFYDAQGRPVQVNYNDTLYTYIRSLQGDVVGFLDGSRNLVVEYKYDAWGKLLSTKGTLANALGQRNPFHYRGYVCDGETQLYYLKKRYYAVIRGQFINADIGLDTRCQEGLNLFCYGLNSPLNFADASGCYAYSTIHNAVCEQISNNNPEIVCTAHVVGISRTASGTGFIDLINPFTGEVWEVKKATLSYSLAEYQLNDYTAGIAYLGKREIDDLKVGGFIPCGVAFYDDLIMPYYYVGNGVIMYETCHRQADGSYASVPSLSPIGEKNLAQNRTRKLMNYPQEALPKPAGGPGIYWNYQIDSEVAWSLAGGAFVVGCAILGYFAGGPFGAYLAGDAALKRTTMK